MDYLSIRQVKLWHFNLCTFVATELLFGVEGWGVWAVSAIVAYALTKSTIKAPKNYIWPLIIWAFAMLCLHLGMSR
ncbi:MULTISPECIES: hypothetical protein [unclassified Novosphingobium]|uniref:hypothetical protein n=1 Tax=unclassified Novosphingobium TaxID=2644732 RepID=UPI000D4A761D|nr:MULTISPECIES: hypothetical protein [unclassified Novosphingobium]PTR05126.1 hypothetical protein C8K11_1446 [Novosphingobium sp. GV055]PUA93742.1 hypothetical protein C8K12_1446 [Novosphingobium sp. GV061]PUB10282.1 hypothetical protein C8K14_1466 [Novosphingobium sp. GV079]PUB36445.1 hypothetical protein C8K10_1436 [Novosphingobium sp. GV027]